MESTTSAGTESREVRCDRCGAKPKLIEKMLDPRRGETCTTAPAGRKLGLAAQIEAHRLGVVR